MIFPEMLDLSSMNIAETNRAKLKALFPSVFTETYNKDGELIESIDFEKLKAELGTFSDILDSRKERYGMEWPGKKEALRLIQQPSYATLKPCREESVNFDTTENLFIEGENLEVLKLLQKSYYGKVKMIYIDPPYNTGKEFIYPDDYKDSLENYLAYAGLVDDEGRKLSTNTANEGRFHTKWLNMMYPRLYLARNLLQEDGVIFINIDDNEVSNLRKLCDEIFGEENFFMQVIIRANSRGQTYNQIAKTHEYLLIYTKNSDTELFELKKEGDKNDLNLSDNIGNFNIRELRNRNPKFGKHNRPNLFYSIYINPNLIDKDGFSPVSLSESKEYFIKIEPFNSSGVASCWRWGKDKIRQNFSQDTLKSNLVAKRKQDGSYSVYEKYRKTTYKPKSIWDNNGFLTETGTVELKSLGLEGIFDFPKPLDLVKQCINLSSESEDIILDFFSGSCTTAHAVLDLNKEDGGNRKFIMVQLPEPCEENSEAKKAGYDTIADIGKERIRRVIQKIQSELDQKEQENQTKLPDLRDEIPQLDLGFKVLKLNASNFNTWQGYDPEIEEGELEKQLELHINHIKPSATQEDILYELLLKSGFIPTEKVENLTLADKTVYSISEGALLICLEDEITRELIDAIAEEEPLQFICLDQAFQGNDQLKANAVQTFESHNKGKENHQQILFRTV